MENIWIYDISYHITSYHMISYHIIYPVICLYIYIHPSLKISNLLRYWPHLVHFKRSGILSTTQNPCWAAGATWTFSNHVVGCPYNRSMCVSRLTWYRSSAYPTMNGCNICIQKAKTSNARERHLWQAANTELRLTAASNITSIFSA